MRVDKGKVRAPEIGRVWLNSAPLSFRQLRSRAALVDFAFTFSSCVDPAAVSAPNVSKI